MKARIRFHWDGDEKPVIRPAIQNKRDGTGPASKMRGLPSFPAKHEKVRCIMFTLRDGLMLVLTLSSILAGVLFPTFGAPFQPYPMYCMMVLLFFSFLPIRFSNMLYALRASWAGTLHCLLFKLVLLPVLVFVAFHSLLPEYALAALLLSGVSSGVASPFFAVLVQANMAIVLGMVVMSSILVPFTLPTLVHVLMGREMSIPFAAMSYLLGMVIFVPLFIAEVLKRFTPAVSTRLMEIRYPASLLCFVITNLGIFSKYASFLREQPSTVAVAFGVATVLAGFYFVAGTLVAHNRPPADRLAAVVSFGLINNVLVLVFSSEFFGPLEPTVAAMYNVPFFSLIIPLRFYQKWAMRRSS